MFIIFMTEQEKVSNYTAWPTEMATKNDQDPNSLTFTPTAFVSGIISWL